MKIDVKNFEAQSEGSIELDETVFGLEPRRDILFRVVRYQLAKRRAGTHKVKTRRETSYSTKKIVRQKGSGGARHGDRNAPIFRHGGVYKGPTPRSYAHALPKKIRALGLKHALSSKQAAGKLLIIDQANPADGKAKALADAAKNLGFKKALIIDSEVSENLARAAGNIDTIDVLPTVGANVYDILRRDTLILTKSAVEQLEARLK